MSGVVGPGCQCQSSTIQLELDDCILSNKIGMETLKSYESDISQMHVSIHERDYIIEQCNARGNDVINQLQTYQLLMSEQSELLAAHVKHIKELEVKLNMYTGNDAARATEAARENAREARQDEARRQEREEENRRKRQDENRSCPSSKITHDEIKSKCRDTRQYRQTMKLIHPDKNSGCVEQATAKAKLCNDVRR